MTQEIITSFKIGINLPNKEFTSYSVVDVKVELIKTKKVSNQYMRGTRVGEYFFEEIGYKWIIPDYIYNYLKESLPQYKIMRPNDISYFKDIKNFPKTVYSQEINELKRYINTLLNDCLYLKKLEQYEKYNKVIFYNTGFGIQKTRDNYNFADTGNKLHFEFRYFVCYEVPSNKTIFSDVEYGVKTDDKKAYHYYGLKKNGRDNEQMDRLPFIPDNAFSGMIKIPWTLEREQFLSTIEDKLKKIHETINDYLKQINENQIDFMIKNIKLLELKDDN